MSRRTLTLLVSLLLSVGLTVLAFALPVPYVLLSGGPVFNTTGAVQGTPVISITGRETYATDGQLDLTTVNVQRRITLAEAVGGWFNRSEAVAPSEIFFPPGQTDQQIQQMSAEEMVTSQSSAKTAALGELGIPVTVTVAETSPGSPAAAVLQPNDDLVSVDGQPVTSPTRLRELISAVTPGQAVQVVLTRDGTRLTRSITTTAATEDPRRAVIGIARTAVTRYPFEISIALEDVGGPSAGLMFSLGIIDKLTPGSLTDGKHIAGTGEIDDQGTVSPIGGIQQKMAAAGEEGVDVFLVPTDNCADAQANKPDGLQLVRVTTLDSAMTALADVRAGRTPQGCT